MISLEKWKILTPLQNLPRNVGDLGKLIAAKGFKKLPKVQKLPNLVTLHNTQQWYLLHSYWDLSVHLGCLRAGRVIKGFF